MLHFMNGQHGKRRLNKAVSSLIALFFNLFMLYYFKNVTD